ncbi:hypothetical protein WJX73_003992 [Symbiochloris irregularis]|uniref:Purple acid phosphatase n=1 Tax=Symbiochloris irregularis TaxID=706552 RepID=A0AAW1NYV5_9CHLO
MTAARWALLALALQVALTSVTAQPASLVYHATPGPSDSQPGVNTASQAVAPAPSYSQRNINASAPGSPARQPADFPQISIPYNTHDPSSSNPLSINKGVLAMLPESQPDQIHLAYGGANADGTNQSVYVSWATGAYVVKKGAVKLPKVHCTASMVTFGTSPDDLTEEATGSATAYTQIYYPYEGSTSYEANYSSPSLHHVKITGLEPNTVYYYTVGDGSPEQTSPVLNFTTAPLAGTTGFSLILVGDLGQTHNSSATLDHMMESLTDVQGHNAAPHLLYTADYSYADDYQSNGTETKLLPNGTKHANFQSYQPREDSYARFISPITEQYMYMGTVGNHEIQLQGNNKTNFQAWLHRYVFPWRESGSDSPFYYSYNYGAAHIISLANYVWPNYKYNSPQYLWLEKDLKAVNRKETPWIVVIFHNPWYSTFSFTDFKQQDCFRQVLEPLMYAYGVDFVFNGHVHSYERFYPVNKWEIDECGYTSIVVGDGGNIEGLTTQFVDTPGACTQLSNGAYYFQDICAFDAAGDTVASFPGGNISGFCPPANYQPSASAFREPSFGHGVLEILSDTEAYWAWHRNQQGDKSS